MSMVSFQDSLLSTRPTELFIQCSSQPSCFSIFRPHAFVVWCVLEAKAANENMTEWRRWITLKCTWLYIGTQDAWALFIVVLYFSKYSKMKLGKSHEKPEFNDATYFTMLFAAGIGIGLFYFGVGK